MATQPTPAPAAISQRELLGLICGCAARASATFPQAEFAVRAAGVTDDARALARELLTDLAIRGWIVLRTREPDRAERDVERHLWQLELAEEPNWDEGLGSVACYALTERGRASLHRGRRR